MITGLASLVSLLLGIRALRYLSPSVVNHGLIDFIDSRKSSFLVFSGERTNPVLIYCHIKIGSAVTVLGTGTQ